MSSSSESKRAKLAARSEVHELLREAGKLAQTVESVDLLLEEICQAVGLNQRRTSRLLARVGQVLKDSGPVDLTVGDYVAVDRGVGQVSKITKKTVYLVFEGKVTPRRVSKADLVISAKQVVAPSQLREGEGSEPLVQASNGAVK